MSMIFGEKISVAIFCPREDIETKVKVLFKGKDEFAVDYFSDEQQFKENFFKNNYNICFLGAGGVGEDKDLSQKQLELPRELRAHKSGTYIILLTDSTVLTKLMTIFRIGINGMVAFSGKQGDYKRELDRAVDHLHTWKNLFEQMLVDKAAEKEFEELFNDSE